MSENCDKRELREAYEELCEASIAKDAARMRTVLAPDYALVHMTGMRQSREAYIASVLDGTLNYYSAEHESLEVSLEAGKDSAVVCACSLIEAAVFGGGKRIWPLKQMLKARKRDSAWVFSESRASMYR